MLDSAIVVDPLIDGTDATAAARATAELDALDHPAEATASAKIDRSIAARWTERLAAPFCPVSSYFLQNYHRLGGSYGLNSTEAMLIVQLVDFKWSASAPYPTTATLATRLGISQRQVRSTLQRLEELGWLFRERPTQSSANRYRLEPLFRRLEQMKDDDERASKPRKVA